MTQTLADEHRATQQRGRKPFWTPRNFTRVALIMFVGITLSTGAKAWSSKRFVYRSEGKRLPEVLQDFAAAESVPLVLDPSVEGTVNGDFNSRPEEFLGAIGKSYGLIWYFDGVSLFVYPSRAMQSRVFRMRGYDRRQVGDLLRSLGLGDPRFPLRFNDAEQTLLAYGPPRHVEIVQTVIDALDGGVRDRSDKAIRVVPLRFAVAADRVTGQTRVPGVASILNKVFGEAAPTDGGTSVPERPLPDHGGVVGQAEKRRIAEASFGLKLPEPDREGGRKEEKAENAHSPAPVQQEQPLFQADEASNAVIVRGMPERMSQYEEIIKQLDIAQDLVEIEAQIIDITGDEFESLGVEWQLGKNGQTRLGISPVRGGANGAATGALTNPNITTLLVDGGRELLARIRFLEGAGKARIIARPKVLGSANRIATMVDKRIASVRVQGNLDVNLFTVEAGTTLQFVPQIVPSDGDGRQVRLTLFIEDGNFEAQQVDAIPIVRRTEIRTEAAVREGESLLIGGMSVESEIKNRSGLPGLSRVPFVGGLFRNDEVTTERRQRMFLITPKIVNQRSEGGSSQGARPSVAAEPAASSGLVQELNAPQLVEPTVEAHP